MIEASVRRDEEGSGYGTFSFVALPSPGDRIIIGNNSGANDVLTVEYVEHHPVKQPRSPTANPAPWITIAVSFHSSFGAAPYRPAATISAASAAPATTTKASAET